MFKKSFSRLPIQSLNRLNSKNTIILRCFSDRRRSSFNVEDVLPAEPTWSVKQFFSDALKQPPISDEIFQNTCNLAYLEPTEATADGLKKDLGTMVEYVKQIQKVDKKGAKPLVSVSSAQRKSVLSTLKSENETKDAALDRATLLNLAPRTQDGFYVVPSSTDEQDITH